MLLLALALVLLSVPAANAQTYATPGITTSAPLTPGATVTVSACCYVPGSTVTFTLTAPTGAQTFAAVAGADGVASAAVTVPADAGTGTVTVAAAGVPIPGSGTPSVQTVSDAVAGPGVVPGIGGLPVTGTDSALPLSLIAVVLLAGGGAALLASRRRAELQHAGSADGNGGSPTA